MARSILIIEDEQDFAEFVVTGLAEEGFAVDHALDGAQALAMLEAGRTWDLILLDWLLPHIDGLTLLRRFRQSGQQTPVIFLTARDEVDDRVRGLDSGADDYLCKPFAFAELVARIRALVRRRERPSSYLFVHGDLVLDPIANRAQRAGTVLDLTAKELALLSLFLRNPGRILTREEIYREVWGEGFDTCSNTFEVHLKDLRHKLECKGPRVIHNRRAQGYFLGRLIKSGKP
jgi:DNA-binding response OmpR family regulator